MDRRKFIKKANVLKTEFRGKFNHVDLWSVYFNDYMMTNLPVDSIN